MSKKNTGKFFSGKGYYIALILGAMAIGLSGYLYYANSNNPEDTQVANQGESALVGATQTDGTVAPETTNPAPTEPVQKPQKPANRVAPVTGETIISHAVDALCYNPTTRDWRTHNGVDIAAAAGTKVRAAADGTVHAVYEDETMGMTVVIHHEGGYTTTYSALAEEISVKAGDQVTAGQTIGQVGNTALMETAIGDHLHFAVSCGEETVDPAEFLAE